MAYKKQVDYFIYFSIDKSAGALSSMNMATIRLKCDSLWMG